MKNKFKYLKNFLKVLIWPIIFTIGQFLIQYIFVAIFNNKEKIGYSEKEFLKYKQTSTLKKQLSTAQSTLKKF